MKINFEKLFDEKILKRGYNYYLEDSVHDVTRNANHYEGLVYGTEIYEVQIEIDDNGNVEDMDCDCPYAEENNCKHMVALLYYLENDGEIESKKAIRNTDNYDKILDKISENEIKEFVLEKIYENFDFQNEFRSHFVQYFEKTPKKVYEKRIAQSIYQAIGRKGFIEYNETYKFSNAMYDYIQEANNLIKHNEYQAPFWIASLILEELPDLPIDDSDGTTSYVESECVEVIEKILEKCKNDSVIKEIFNWIIESIKNDTLGDYSDGIEKVLDEHFIEDKFVNERLKIIDEKIQELEQQEDHYSEYKLEELIKTKIALLYQLGMDKEAIKTIKENIYYVPIRRMLIDIERKNENIDKVEKLLKEGMKIALKRGHYGTVTYYIEELLSIYKEHNQKEKYKNLVEETLFKYSRGSFKYYKKLKDLYTEEQWKNMRDNIIKILESDGEGYHRDDLRQIYIEEQYYEKLYNSVMSTPLFEIVVKYEKYLKKDFEKQLLEEYQKIVNEKARFTGKRNYEDVRKILQHMKTLKNGENLVEKMVEEYKIKYANRRLMLEELNKI